MRICPIKFTFRQIQISHEDDLIDKESFIIIIFQIREPNITLK